jgi:hypothetical protein
MNSNIGIQTTGLLAWSGTAATARSLSSHTRFAFSFEALATIATTAVFKVQSAPASAVDKCLPGTFADVNEVAICAAPAVPAGVAQVSIPAGTLIGAVCSGTLPCKPGEFIQLVPVSGDTANIRAILLLQGPVS